MNIYPAQSNPPLSAIEDIQFTDLFNLENIQSLQDLFADSHGVASIITYPDGSPITKPSNFTRFCTEIVRNTEKGCANCFKSDAIIGYPDLTGPIVQPCLSGGLWDAGASINVGGKHLANWLIGQVQNEDLDKNSMIGYAEEIGANGEEYMKALSEVPVMSTEKFHKIAKMLFAFANELSEKAFINLQLKRQIELNNKTTKILRESQETTQTLLNGIPESVFLMEADGKVITANSTIANRLGINVNQIVNQNIYSALPNELAEHRRKHVEKVILTKKPLVFDDERLGRIIENRIYPIKNENGSVSRIAVVGIDITERKQTDLALNLSEEKFRNIFENSAVGNSVTTIGGKLQTNEAFCQILGYTEDELKKLHWKDITHPDCIEHDQGILDSLLSGKMKTARWEKRYIHKNGNIVWVDINSTLQRDNAGNPSYFITSINDITSRKLAEQALLESEWKFQAIFKKGPIGVAYHEMIYDEAGNPKDYKYIDANETFIELTGTDPRGKTVTEAFPGIENDPANWIGVFGKVAKTGESIRYEQYLQANNRWYDCVAYQFKPDFFVVAFQETTKRKQAEIALAASEERWKRAIADSPIPIMIHDEDNRVIQLSKGWTKFSGYTIDDIPTLGDWTELAYGQRSGFEKEYIDNLFSINETVKNGEWTVTAKDGTKRLWDFQTTPLGNINENKRVLHSLAIDITEQKQAQDAVLKSESIQRKMVSNIGDVIVIIDKEGINRYKSPNIRKLFGWNPKEVVGVSTWENLHPEDIEMAKQFIDSLAKATNLTNSIECRYRCQDGSYKWIEFTGVNLLDDPEINGILGNYHDITNRKLADEILRQSESFLKEVQNIAHIGTYSLEICTGIWTCSEILDEIFGIGPDFPHDINGWVKMIHPNWQVTMNDYFFGEVIGKRIKFDKEYQIIRQSDQAIRWVHGIGNLKFDKNDQVISMIGTIQDITERKLAEEEIAKSNRIIEENAIMLQSITDNIPAFIGVVDAKNLFYKFVNQRFTLGFNKNKENIVGHHISDIIGKENTDFAMKYIEEVRNGKSSSYINTFEFAEGKRYINVNYVPGIDKDGVVKDILVLSYDITDIKKSEEELVVAKERAEESDRLKSAFLANMSHEIRTPLNSIIGFSELLDDPDYSPKQKSEFIETIIQQGNNLLVIINDIMDLSMLESKQIVIRKENFTIGKFMNDLTNIYETLANAKGIGFKCNIPAECESLMIKNDHFRIKQILNNLISNALKFTNKGSVELGCSLHSNNFQFYVKDTGIGIPKEFHHSIFERFIQVDTSWTRKFGGNGLGLAISKNLADMLGGTIRLESEPGVGSSFYFSFPLDISKTH